MDDHSLFFGGVEMGKLTSICSSRSDFQPEEGGPAEQKLLDVIKAAGNKFNPFVVLTLLFKTMASARLFLKLDNRCLTLQSQTTQHLTVISCLHRAHSNLEP